MPKLEITTNLNMLNKVEKHYFTPRFLSVEEARNAAGQQPQVSNQSKVAHDSQVWGLIPNVSLCHP